MRLFVALLLEPELHAAATERQARLASLDVARSVRWLDPTGLHVTLKFLGEVAEERLDAIRRAAATAVRHPAPRLGLAGCGAFPSAVRPRVVWLGLAGDVAGLAALHADLDAAFEPLGWPRESRPFAAHVTVGRCQHAATLRPELRQALQNASVDPGSPAPPLPQTRVALMQSHLQRSGARYEEIAVWKLDAAGGAASA